MLQGRKRGKKRRCPEVKKAKRSELPFFYPILLFHTFHYLIATLEKGGKKVPSVLFFSPFFSWKKLEGTTFAVSSSTSTIPFSRFLDLKFVRENEILPRWDSSSSSFPRSWALQVCNFSGWSRGFFFLPGRKLRGNIIRKLSLVVVWVALAALYYKAYCRFTFYFESSGSEMWGNQVRTFSSPIYKDGQKDGSLLGTKEKEKEGGGGRSVGQTKAIKHSFSSFLHPSLLFPAKKKERIEKGGERK